MSRFSRIFGFLLIFGLFSGISFADSAPQFKLPGQNGIVDLSAMRGHVVYLDFWASWCSPCRKSFPWMNEMYNKYRADGFKIVAVNLDKDRDAIDSFLASNPTDFTIAFDPDGRVAKTYKLVGMPSSYLIDKSGKLQVSHIGFREKDKEELESKIKNLLAQQ
jgi:cytochrome c biogenesis protein CcmG/thiol:disulfide interchange protein DsbE